MNMVGFEVIPFERRYICVFFSGFVIKLAYALGIGLKFDLIKQDKEVRFWL